MAHGAGKRKRRRKRKQSRAKPHNQPEPAIAPQGKATEKGENRRDEMTIVANIPPAPTKKKEAEGGEYQKLHDGKKVSNFLE
jgi:hypothetical protein